MNTIPLLKIDMNYYLIFDLQSIHWNFFKTIIYFSFSGRKVNKGPKMFLLKPLTSFIFIATFHDLGEAAPKDVHIHLHGLNKELAKADALGRSESGTFG